MSKRFSSKSRSETPQTKGSSDFIQVSPTMTRKKFEVMTDLELTELAGSLGLPPEGTRDELVAGIRWHRVNINKKNQADLEETARHLGVDVSCPRRGVERIKKALTDHYSMVFYKTKTVKLEDDLANAIEKIEQLKHKLEKANRIIDDLEVRNQEPVKISSFTADPPRGSSGSLKNSKGSPKEKRKSTKDLEITASWAPSLPEFPSSNLTPRPNPKPKEVENRGYDFMGFMQ